MEKQTLLKKIKIVLIVLLYLVCLGALFFVGNIEIWSGMAAVVAAILSIVCFCKKKNAVPILLVICAVLEVIWILEKIYLCYLLGLYIMFLTDIWLVVEIVRTKTKEQKTVVKWLKRVIGAVLSVVILGVTCFLSVTGASSVPLIKYMQKNMMGGAGNYYEPKPNIINSIDNGNIIANVQYGSEYPNSYLDIYLTDAVPAEEAPTYIFFHGGGYVWGDKQEGDPNGGSNKGLQWYFQKFVEKGYNVVAPNYVLGPDYRFPEPLIQMSQMMGFLNENAEKYHLNMDNVILGGNSGGGQLAGILACIQTDKNYSEKIGIEQSLNPEYLKAVVFSSALIDNDRSYRTKDPGADFLFLQCGKSYYGWDLMEGKTEIVNLIDNVTDKFPPSYISDGNSGTFYEQAFDFHDKLNSLNVENEINWYPEKEMKLGHDFETQGTEYSEKNLEKLLEFLDDKIK